MGTLYILCLVFFLVALLIKWIVQDVAPKKADITATEAHDETQGDEATQMDEVAGSGSGTEMSVKTFPVVGFDTKCAADLR